MPLWEPLHIRQFLEAARLCYNTCMPSELRRGHSVKGFTLIELLLVIAIVAILSAIVLLYLNPAELIKQARDSNRFSDLDTLKRAISVYLSDVTNPSLGTAGVCYQSSSVGTSTAGRLPAVVPNCH